MKFFKKITSSEIEKIVEEAFDTGSISYCNWMKLSFYHFISLFKNQSDKENKRGG